jgi:N-acetylglucosaminyl-diphospho-decaprenol L-rhamnosyltransferase
MAPIAVCIVNHNTRELLRACVDSVQREAPSELVVVDNASFDGSTEMVEAEFPVVSLIRNGTNLGYGAAANQAIADCTAEYVLLLNSDTILQPSALRDLSIYLHQNPQAAIVGPRIVNLDGTLQRSCFPFPTPLDISLDVSNLSQLIRYIPVLREVYLRTWSHGRVRRVPWVLGAALAIRRDAFEAVGGFDDSFFMYYEEVDLCYRLAETGWETHFAPVTDVVHVGGASTQQRRADMTVRFFASLAQFYRRHYSRVRQAELGALVACIALARLIRDSVSIRLTRDPDKRAGFAGDLTSWRRLLVGEWREQALRSVSPRTDGVMAR